MKSSRVLGLYNGFFAVSVLAGISVAPTLLSAQQEQITVSDLRESGITLTPVPNATLPSAYLMNNNAKPVLAVALQWTQQLPTTNETRQHNRTYLQWDITKPILQPFEKRVVSVEHVPRLQQQLGTSRVVNLRVDAVIFSDGTTAGQDVTGLRDYVRAKIDATRDLMSSVVDMRKARTDVEIVGWLKQLLNTPRAQRVLPQRPQLSRDKYRRAYYFHQEAEARLLAGSKSLNDVFDRAQRLLSTPGLTIQ